MKIPKTDFALYISQKGITVDSYGGKRSGTVEVGVVTVDEGRIIRNPRDTEYDDLIFRCQWNEGMEDDKPFAFTVEYRSVYTVDLSKAKRMVKFLTKVNAATGRMGIYPTSFGQYCVLMARLLGILHYVSVEGEHHGWSYDENKHHVWPLPEGQRLIDESIRKAQEAQRSIA